MKNVNSIIKCDINMNRSTSLPQRPEQQHIISII